MPYCVHKVRTRDFVRPCGHKMWSWGWEERVTVAVSGSMRRYLFFCSCHHMPAGSLSSRGAPGTRISSDPKHRYSRTQRTRRNRLLVFSYSTSTQTRTAFKIRVSFICFLSHCAAGYSGGLSGSRGRQRRACPLPAVLAVTVFVAVLLPTSLKLDHVVYCASSMQAVICGPGRTAGTGAYSERVGACFPLNSGDPRPWT
jgi:hypothetical protein